MRSLIKPKSIPANEQVAYWQRWKDGDATAGAEILASYEGYIHKFLHRTYGKRVVGQNYDDALSAARIGFYKALDKFDPAKEVQIGTYAVFWMRAEVDETLRQIYNGVRRTNNSYFILKELNAQIGKTSPQQQSLGETFEKVASRLNVPVDRVRHHYERANRATVPLDAKPYGDEDNRPVAETIVDGAPDPSEAISRRQISKALHEAIEQLDPRSKKIICLRFGIAADDDGLTLDELGREFGISKERVRQLEVRAIEKMRGYLGDAYRPDQ